MKRYSLICPFCMENDTISVKLHDPEEMTCGDCGEIDIKKIQEMIAGWSEYLKDVNEMLEKEKQTKKGAKS